MASAGASLTSLVVHDIPPDTDSKDVQLFFSSQKNGGAGDVEEVQFPLDGSHPHSARVFFGSLNTVVRVTSQERIMRGSRLRLEPAHPQTVNTLSSITPADKSRFCAKHVGSELTYVCLSCGSAALCSRCVRDEHRDHAWNLTEDVVNEKKREVEKTMMPDLRNNLDHFTKGVEILKKKQQEADANLARELGKVGESKDKSLVRVNADFDDMVIKLRRDLSLKEKEIEQEAATVCDSIQRKWDDKKQELNVAEAACSQQLQELATAVYVAEVVQTGTQLGSITSLIFQATTTNEASEDLKSLPETEATLPDTAHNLEKFAELSLRLLPKSDDSPAAEKSAPLHGGSTRTQQLQDLRAYFQDDSSVNQTGGASTRAGGCDVGWEHTTLSSVAGQRGTARSPRDAVTEGPGRRACQTTGRTKERQPPLANTAGSSRGSDDAARRADLDDCSGRSQETSAAERRQFRDAWGGRERHRKKQATQQPKQTRGGLSSAGGEWASRERRDDGRETQRAKEHSWRRGDDVGAWHGVDNGDERSSRRRSSNTRDVGVWGWEHTGLERDDRRAVDEDTAGKSP